MGDSDVSPQLDVVAAECAAIREELRAQRAEIATVRSRLKCRIRDARRLCADTRPDTKTEADQLRRMFLDRLDRLARMGAAPQAARGRRGRLLGRALVSTYQDCELLGAGSAAQALLKSHRG